MSRTNLRRVAVCCIAVTAASFAVGTLAPPAGASVTVSVPCSGAGGGGAGLQAAVANANANGGGTITLAAGCTYTLTAAQSGGHDSAGSGLVVKSSISVVGNKATIARDSTAGDFGILEVDSGTVTVADVTITGGRINGINHGGGVSQFGGSLTLNKVDVVNNTGLSTTQPNPGGVNVALGTAVLKQVTIANSTSPGTAALLVQSSATVTLSQSTVAANTSTESYHASIWASNGATLTMAGNLLADDTDYAFAQCGFFTGTPVDQGYNFSSDHNAGNSCKLNAATDGASGSVSPLEDLGGGMQAVVPRFGSAATDAIPTSSSLCTGNDPRGVPRPQGTACDAGAAEKGVATVALTTTGATVSEGVPWKITLTASTTTTALGAPTRTFPLYTGYLSTGRVTMVTLNGGSPNTASFTPFPLPQGANHFVVYYLPTSYPEDDRFHYDFDTSSADVTVTAPPLVPCSGAGGGADGLAAAITAANSGSGGGATLEAGCTYTLTSVAATEHGPNGLPVVSKPFVIRGNGAVITRDPGAPPLRLLNVNYNRQLALYDLTLTGGATTDVGGAVQVNGGATLYGDSVDFRNNSSMAAYGGGALWNNGTTTLLNSTLSGNNAAGGPGGAIVTTTGLLTLDSDTIVGNTSAAAPAGVFGYIGGYAKMARTLLSNAGGDCGGTLPTDNGYVYSDDTTCGLTAATSVMAAGAAAHLVETPYHGGSLFAMPNGGPGKDAVLRAACMQPGGGTPGDSVLTPAPDARGVSRPQNGLCDVGAVEVTRVLVAATADKSAVESGDTVTFTVTVTTTTPASPPNGTLSYYDLDDVAHSVPVVGSSPVVVTLPMTAGPAGYHLFNFRYAGDGTQSAASSTAVSVLVAPVLSTIIPARGPASGGTKVTVTGKGFDGVDYVEVGGREARRLHVVSPTELTFVTPPGVSGPTDVQLFGGGAGSAQSSADVFTYTPTITALSPASGRRAGGTVVTITGSGFTHSSTVRFGHTVASSVTYVSKTELQATSPVHAPGTVHVRVNTAHVLSPASADDRFTYRAPAAALGAARAV